MLKLGFKIKTSRKVSDLYFIFIFFYLRDRRKKQLAAGRVTVNTCTYVRVVSQVCHPLVQPACSPPVVSLKQNSIVLC